MELRTRHLGAFGKLASQGDFVTFGSNTDPALRFHDYLFAAVEAAYASEPAWCQTAESDRAFAFIYRTSSQHPGEGLVTGVLRSSHDATGRVFPFAVYAVIDALGCPDETHILPLSLGGFLEQASVALDDAVEGISTGDPTGELVGPSTAQLHAAVNDYAIWTTSRTMEEAWMTLFGRNQPGDLANALATIGEILGPFSGSEPPATKLAARLPLGAAGSGAVSFWWDTARRLGRWQRNVPMLFWEGGAPEPQVVMHFGDVAPRALAELWVPKPDSAFASDLSAAANDRPGVQLDSAAAFLKRLESPAMLVSDFLSAL